MMMMMVSKVERRGRIDPSPSPPSLYLRVSFLGLCLLGLKNDFGEGFQLTLGRPSYLQ